MDKGERRAREFLDYELGVDPRLQTRADNPDFIVDGRFGFEGMGVEKSTLSIGQIEKIWELDCLVMVHGRDARHILTPDGSLDMSAAGGNGALAVYDFMIREGMNKSDFGTEKDIFVNDEIRKERMETDGYLKPVHDKRKSGRY